MQPPSLVKAMAALTQNVLSIKAWWIQHRQKIFLVQKTDNDSISMPSTKSLCEFSKNKLGFSQKLLIFPDFSLTFCQKRFFPDLFQNSLIIPCPWKNLIFPDFSLTCGNPAVNMANAGILTRTCYLAFFLHDHIIFGSHNRRPPVKKNHFKGK